MKTIRVANAPCSWGVLEFELEGGPLEPAQVLDEMAQAGYLGTELGDWGFLPADPQALRLALEERGLELVGAFVPMALAKPQAQGPGVQAALRAARLLAGVSPTAFVVLADDNGTDPVRVRHAGRVRPEHGLSPPRWDCFVQGAMKVAQAVREETGVRTVFHPHCGGYVETPAEVELFLARTDPQLVGLCFDTGHYAYGGGDALQGFHQHRERIWHVHFKDCQPRVAAQARVRGWDYFEAVRHGVFCELGQGQVNFGGLVEALERGGYDGWVVVEQDVLPGLGTPLQSAQRNRDYLRQLGL